MGTNRYENTNRGKRVAGVNPQGYDEEAQFYPDPKSALENKAKKDNTKR